MFSQDILGETSIGIDGGYFVKIFKYILKNTSKETLE